MVFTLGIKQSTQLFIQPGTDPAIYEGSNAGMCKCISSSPFVTAVVTS